MLLPPMKGLLEEEGFEVLIARDGREAVAVHSANAPGSRRSSSISACRR